MRSAAAVLAGFATVFALSLGIDQVLHLLHVYPPWGEPMHQPGLNLLALAYRIPIGVLGGWVTARLAPHSPLRHALTMGAIGLVLSSLGALAAIRADLGPAWYPLALAASAVPCAWLGGTLAQRRLTASGDPGS